MSSSTATEVHSETSSKENAPKQENPNIVVPTGYYFLVLFSPLLIGLAFVLGGLLLVLTGVLLILAFPAFLIIGPFFIPRRVSPDDPRWGWKSVLDKKSEQLRVWVKQKISDEGWEAARKNGFKIQ